MLFITDKDRNGIVSPGDVSKALEAGQKLVYEKYWKLGRGRNEESGTPLLPFSVKTTVTTSAAGVITLPTDFGNIRLIEADGLPYKEKDATEVPFALKSQLRPVEDYPFYVIEDGTYKVYPARATSLGFHYYKTPAAPLIAYTVVGQDPVYDPTNSVQLTFKERYWMEVIHSALPYIGVKLSSPDLYSLANLYNATPQPNQQ